MVRDNDPKNDGGILDVSSLEYLSQEAQSLEAFGNEVVNQILWVVARMANESEEPMQRTELLTNFEVTALPPDPDRGRGYRICHRTMTRDDDEEGSFLIGSKIICYTVYTKLSSEVPPEAASE